VAVQELVGRQILDLGMSFRLTGEDEERDWPLSPMPLIIGAQEWAQVERGWSSAPACSKPWWPTSTAKGAWSPKATCPPR
jgi:hypothetical protein